MPNYIIATSSTSDLPREYLDEHAVPFISYSYTMGDELFEDDCREESRAEIYRSMRAGARLKTSMINEYSYYEFFKSLLETGKDVIFLDMTQKLSVSYVNSLSAAETARKEFPDRRLYVMDTLCVSGGLAMLVEEMVRRAEAGADYDEVIAWGEANKLRIAHRFTVDDLNYLKAGGRVSNASALVGSMLDIKPVLYVPDEGTLEVAQKVRGRKKALNTIIESILRDLENVNTDGARMRILHADCIGDAETVRDAVRKARPDFGEILISSLGVVIGAHCGPGLLAIFYFCGGRRPK
ncbi:MAG: DegV family protein [Oscillospiraceae bacterium]|nr:DegV family protein [Oscillospiraceae bacterium]